MISWVRRFPTQLTGKPHFWTLQPCVLPKGEIPPLSTELSARGTAWPCSGQRPITDALLLKGPRHDNHAGGFVPCSLASAQAGPSQFILSKGSVSERHWNSQPGQGPFVLRGFGAPQRPIIAPSGTFGGFIGWDSRSTANTGLHHS